MRRIEAQWIKEHLSAVSAEMLSPLLEIGSSSLNFRTVQKPHIEELVYGPLKKRGVQIITADIRSEEGVDIVGDVYDPAAQQQLKAVGARALLLCNIFEHLEDRRGFARICQSFVSPGGLIVVTVPHDYPYHLDPIDTRFRPNVKEIHALFPETELIAGEIITDAGSYWKDLRKMSQGRTYAIVTVVAQVARILTLRGGIDRSLSRISQLRYLFRNYQMAVAMLKVPLKNVRV